MGAQLGDPNREAVGLAPIWTGTEAPPDEGGAQRAPKAPKHAAPAPAPAPSEDTAPGVT
jgi:hypothetical protein